MSSSSSRIVLTGATTGIGRATALALAGQAGRLILHGLEREHDVVDLLRSVRAVMRSDAQLTYLPADYGDLANVTRLAQRIRETTDRIDLLINNAARPGPSTRTLDDTGAYYDERDPEQPNSQACDRATQDRLHDITTEILHDHL